MRSKESDIKRPLQMLAVGLLVPASAASAGVASFSGTLSLQLAEGPGVTSTISATGSGTVAWWYSLVAMGRRRGRSSGDAAR